ncbi:hypothetical protein ACSFA2_06390 [Variovorax sp. LT2P21]|uniref:hypothetical protein n=1 Tax=Variovorax sp. LT2P21 TaxID=3443731 RepID=UPI003F471C96
MNVSRKLRPLTAVLCSGALFAALSAHAVANPPIHMTHGVEYMSGGIGSDEAQFMETVSPRWPATLEFAVKDHTRADFAADVRVTVRTQDGHAVLDNVLAAGPFLVARLAPGRYQVEATLSAQTLKQDLTVLPGAPAKAVLLWPANTDMAASTGSTARSTMHAPT